MSMGVGQVAILGDASSVVKLCKGIGLHSLDTDNMTNL